MSEAVVAVFVQERQELHRRAVLRGVEDDVDAPRVVDAVGLDSRGGPRRALGPHRPAYDLQAARRRTRCTVRNAPLSPCRGRTACTRRYPKRRWACDSFRIARSSCTARGVGERVVLVAWLNRMT